MPRSSKGSKMPQRQPPRGVRQVRPSNSDSHPLHHRPITDRSSAKVGDCRYRRGNPRSDPLNQKKLGTRIADLETQLGQAQKELKILKGQMNAKAAKKEAREQMEKTENTQDSNKTDSSLGDEVPQDNECAIDVFEAPLGKVAMEPKVEVDETDHVQERTEAIETSTHLITVLEPEKPSLNDLALKDDEIKLLNTKLEEKEKENDDLKSQLNEITSNISTAKAKEEEMRLSLRQVREKLEASKTTEAQLKEKLRSVEGQKEALEEEMTKLRAQTEQWRTAADAAAAILCGGEEKNGRLSNRCSSSMDDRLSNRCSSSMDDKHLGGMFEHQAGGYTGYVGFSLDDEDDSCRIGKPKGGIKLLGDLWKKKGHK